MVLVCWYCLALMREETLGTGGDRFSIPEVSNQRACAANRSTGACCCLLFQLDRAWLPLRHWQLHGDCLTLNQGRALYWLQSGLSLIDSVSKCLVVAVCWLPCSDFEGGYVWNWSPSQPAREVLHLDVNKIRSFGMFWLVSSNWLSITALLGGTRMVFTPWWLALGACWNSSEVSVRRSSSMESGGPRLDWMEGVIPQVSGLELADF